jgi:flagellar protein FlaG
MSTNIQASNTSQVQSRLDNSNVTQPLAKSAAPSVVETQIGKTAKERFAKKSEVVTELQSLHKSLQASVERLNAMMKDSGRNLSIGIDKSLGGPVVTVRNAESGEVVRQIPNEVVVKMAHSIEAFKGLLHDDIA